MEDDALGRMLHARTLASGTVFTDLRARAEEARTVDLARWMSFDEFLEFLERGLNLQGGESVRVLGKLDLAGALDKSWGDKPNAVTPGQDRFRIALGHTLDSAIALAQLIGE